MWLDEEAPIRKQNLVFSKSFVNTAGTLGFAPDPHTMPFLEHLGAFITHPISRLPRVPARNRCCLSYSGGFLIHTGLPNPGISRAITRYRRHWANAPLPIVPHLLVEIPKTLTEMVRKLEGLENIMAVELGLPPEVDPSRLPAFMEAAVGELPIILCISPDQAPLMLETLVDVQPAAVHLTGLRGLLPDAEGNLMSGRLHGPGTFPIMLKAAIALMKTGLPVIVDGGVFERRQLDSLMSLGFIAVGLGAVLWEVDPTIIF